MRNLPSEYHKSEAIKLGLETEDLKGHDWVSTNENGNISTNENGNSGGRTIAYLEKQISKGKNPSEAFEEIKGLNGFEIQAIEKGLKRVDLEGHNWVSNNKNGNSGGRTIAYLEKQISKGKNPSEAFEEIKGLNGFEIQAIEKGLEREDLKGHNWVRTSEYGYSGQRTIAYLLGLKTEDLEVNNWVSTNENGNSGGRTIAYLEKQISKGKNPSEAFKEIKGLNGFEIQAIEKGLKREDLEGHNWVSTSENGNSGGRTIAYLESCPPEIPLERAMANIRGCNMIDIVDNKNAGISAGLSPIQVYATPLTREQINRIENGEPYKDVVPEGAKFISQLKQREQAPNTTFKALDTTILTTPQNKEIGKWPQR